eukprot:CAMPEP_0115396854 /NCGR_PEP_ID=MMETSP0271-20121206/13506_1 /TAXON_ID=71861 /ORGANISM="Scrippsiella trochoidea, Strain CCMP3099" /LENGTH=136 /DNA_ID=CAMNT_0002820589 /DNA_START=309 /DNA_END=719 /DNA_ORIENTATION=+
MSSMSAECELLAGDQCESTKCCCLELRGHAVEPNEYRGRSGESLAVPTKSKYRHQASTTLTWSKKRHTGTYARKSGKLMSHAGSSPALLARRTKPAARQPIAYESACGLQGLYQRMHDACEKVGRRLCFQRRLQQA